MNQTFLKISKHLLFLVCLGLVGYFFGTELLANAQKLKTSHFEINYFWLLVSGIFYLGFFAGLTVLRWKMINAKSPQKLGWKENLHVNIIAWSLRYIPGKVVNVLSKVYGIEKYGIPKRISLVACLYENVLQLLTSCIVSVFLLGQYWLGHGGGWYAWASIVCALGGLVGLHPKVFHWGWNLLMRFSKRGGMQLGDFLSGKELFMYLAGYIGVTVVKGLGFAFLVSSILSLNVDQFLFVCGVWIFTNVVGMLAVFAPNGLGVREGVLAMMLASIMPMEIAILLSVLSRVWTLVLDGLIALGMIGVKSE